MKIKKVKWRNHNILGNLEIDFINPLTNEPFDTVIFAGENGTGKTTILETLSTFLNLGSFEDFEFIEYQIGSDTFKAIQPSDGTTYKNFYDILDITGTLQKIRSDKSNNPQLIETNITDIRNCGCVFSKARADYKTQQIKYTTTKILDEDKYDKDNEDDFTSLKQLLVDIHNQDYAEYGEMNELLGASPKSWPEYYPSSRIYRFKNAFNNFFEKIKYEKIDNIKNEKCILFNKNGNLVPIDSLSTGEKQIVFRGSYLLKNNKKLNGATIMIDEPELSMHPRWERKILNYYKNLFTTDSGQNVQLFIATHSEHVLKEGLLNKNDNLVIILNEIDGIIQIKKITAPSVLPTITSAETNYLAFDIVSNDYHIELYGWLQNKNSKDTIKLCDDFIKDHNLYNSTKHDKPSSFTNPRTGTVTNYQTLCTYIRNAIDHPNSTNTFDEIELRASIKLLIELSR